ncbi:hypothetical protein ES705_50296 [subsurface metagenome]
MGYCCKTKLKFQLLPWFSVGLHPRQSARAYPWQGDNIARSGLNSVATLLLLVVPMVLLAVVVLVEFPMEFPMGFSVEFPQGFYSPSFQANSPISVT